MELPDEQEQGRARDVHADDLRITLGIARRAAALLTVLSESKRADIIAVHEAAGECLRTIERFAEAMQVKPARYDVAGLMRAQLYRAEDALVEVVSTRLQAYGELAPGVAMLVDGHLAPLQELILSLFEEVQGACFGEV